MVDYRGRRDLPRGVRSNNPGNVRRDGKTPWRGMSADQSGDKEFVVFDDAKWGVRTICRVLQSYQRRGLKSVRAMISTYAPPSDDNPTESYIRNVADALQVHPDSDVDIYAPEVAEEIVRAIIRVECGKPAETWYDDDVIREGIALAND